MNLLRDFVSCRKQRVAPNGQHSSWDNVTAGDPQGSILGPLLFLIYVNDLANNLSSNCKLFADDMSLFSILNNIHTTAATLSQDLNRITNWAFQWKMIFKPDLSKQKQEVIFSRKIKKLFHPTLLFNNIPLSNSLFHDKLESIQYNACLAINAAIRGTSTEKLYQELGLESLKSRRWFRKLCHFYKIFNKKSPSYLFKLIPILTGFIQYQA